MSAQQRCPLVSPALWPGAAWALLLGACVGGSGSDGGVGDSGTMDAGTFPALYVEAYCRWSAHCTGITPDTLTDCEHLETEAILESDLADSLNSGRLVLNAQFAAECLDAFGQSGCSISRGLPSVCAMALTGTQAEGGICTTPFDCVGGACVAPSRICPGICGPQGGSCTGASECNPWETCVNDQCVEGGLQGGPCELDADCAIGFGASMPGVRSSIHRASLHGRRRVCLRLLLRPGREHRHLHEAEVGWRSLRWRGAIRHRLHGRDLLLDLGVGGARATWPLEQLATVVLTHRLFRHAWSASHASTVGAARCPRRAPASTNRRQSARSATTAMVQGNASHCGPMARPATTVRSSVGDVPARSAAMPERALV